MVANVRLVPSRRSGRSDFHEEARGPPRCGLPITYLGGLRVRLIGLGANAVSVSFRCRQLEATDPQNKTPSYYHIV